tara:strand:+ start:1227 stop:2156 length:930 start_codon:yes stop_codon:yes gene_type:complete
MALTVIQSDVIGTSYTSSQFDYSRFRATRKLIIKSTSTSRTDIIAELTANDAGCSTACTTALGPRITGDFDYDDALDNNSSYAIVHPDRRDLPLQTINIATLGDQRFLVTAEYFTTPGASGGGANIPQTLSMRTEIASKRKFITSKSPYGGGTNYIDMLPAGLNSRADTMKYSYLTTVQQIRIRIPFTSVDPPDVDGPLLYLSGVNSTAVQLLAGNPAFAAGTIRFDGITMDEYGGLISDGVNTYRYKGHYELTGRADGFQEDCVERIGGQWMVQPCYPSVDEKAEWASLCELGVPGWAYSGSDCVPTP